MLWFLVPLLVTAFWIPMEGSLLAENDTFFEGVVDADAFSTKLIFSAWVELSTLDSSSWWVGDCIRFCSVQCRVCFGTNLIWIFGKCVAQGLPRKDSQIQDSRFRDSTRRINWRHHCSGWLHREQLEHPCNLQPSRPLEFSNWSAKTRDSEERLFERINYQNPLLKSHKLVGNKTLSTP